MIEVTTSLTPHSFFSTAGTAPERAPAAAAHSRHAAAWMPVGMGTARDTTIAMAAPMKNAPSEIMENWPARKMIITASAVKISGQAPSTILPIRRRDRNGPMKKL